MTAVNGQFDRCFVATLLPYRPGSFTIDEEAYRQHIRYFLQPNFLEIGGALVVNPEAGEVFYTTREEKRRLVEIALEEAHGKTLVFAGISAPTTEEAVLLARDMRELGVDGLFLMPPIGAGDVTIAWDPARYPEYFSDMAYAICAAVDLPAIVHPTATLRYPWGVGFPAEAVDAICRAVPWIVGWKMTYSYEGYRRVARVLRSLPRHVGILAASGLLFNAVLADGLFDGTVSGSFTYAMERMAEHIRAWCSGQCDLALQIWRGGLADLHEYIYSDYARLHIRYKVAAWLRGLIPSPLMRPPMPRPNPAEIQTLRDLLTRCGYEIIPEKDVQTFAEKVAT